MLVSFCYYVLLVLANQQDSKGQGCHLALLHRRTHHARPAQVKRSRCDFRPSAWPENFPFSKVLGSVYDQLIFFSRHLEKTARRGSTGVPV